MLCVIQYIYHILVVRIELIIVTFSFTLFVSQTIPSLQITCMLIFDETHVHELFLLLHTGLYSFLDQETLLQSVFCHNTNITRGHRIYYNRIKTLFCY